MKYTPYYRVVKDAETAALFVHGIVGTPAHFKDLVPVIPEDWSVYNILLDGHGKNVEDFARTSMKKWQQQVTHQVDEILKTHKNIFIVAHSMGTLFAIDEAIRQPKKIIGLFLLAVPLTPWVRPSAALDSVKLALGRAKPGSSAMNMLGDCGVHLSPKLWKYVAWIPRFVELLVEAQKAKKKLPQLAVPCRTYQSDTDELVSRSSIRYVTGHRYITNTILFESGHFCYSPNDTHLLQVQLREMIDTI